MDESFIRNGFRARNFELVAVRFAKNTLVELFSVHVADVEAVGSKSCKFESLGTISVLHLKPTAYCCFVAFVV